MQSNSTLRKFIRHPSDVPIQVTLARAPKKTRIETHSLNNVSLGGLSFLCRKALPLDQYVKIFFPLLDHIHSLKGKVVWVNELPDGFETGIEFENSDELYTLRMIEQVCHIEHYRKQIEQLQGRKLNSEEAAKEWINRYAGEFPGLSHDR